MSAASRLTPLPRSVRRAAIAPTIVTSSPSRIHTVPRPITMRQWKRDQGSRSRRAGTSVRIVLGGTVVLIACPPDTVSLGVALSPARPSIPLRERGRGDALAVPALRGGGRKALPDRGGRAALRPR